MVDGTARTVRAENNLIAFVGLKGSGKDTAANYLIEHGYQGLAFADSIKDCLSSIFCWDRELLNGDTKESRAWREQVDPWWALRLGIDEFTPRWAMTNFGTDVMRKHFNPHLWILNTDRRIERIYENDENAGIVIKDGRFPNELDAARERGGYVIRIKRGDEPEWYDVALAANQGSKWALDRMAETYADVHVSEWAWIGEYLDATIENDGTIADLHDKVGSFIDSIYPQ